MRSSGLYPFSFTSRNYPATEDERRVLLPHSFTHLLSVLMAFPILRASTEKWISPKQRAPWNLNPKCLPPFSSHAQSGWPGAPCATTVVSDFPFLLSWSRVLGGLNPSSTSGLGALPWLTGLLGFRVGELGRNFLASSKTKAVCLQDFSSLLLSARGPVLYKYIHKGTCVTR